MSADPTTPTRQRRDPQDAVPYSVQVAAAFAWRILAIALGLAVVVLGLAYGKVLWVPVVIALLLAVLLTPVVRLLTTRLRFGQGAASATAVLLLVVVVAGLLTIAGRAVVNGFADLWDQALAGIDKLLTFLADGPLGLDSDQLSDYVDQLSGQLSANSGSLLSGAVSVTTTIGHVAVGALITLFCLLFFLKDGPQIWAWLLRLLPVPARQPSYEASRRGVVTLESYVRAQILVAFVDAVGIGLGAAILGLPLVLPLTLLVFLASFVPFVGAIATGSIAVLVALVDQGPGSALIMLAIVLAVQQLEGHVLQPLLLGHAVSLHPVAVLLAVTAGSLTAGIVGALLAVPLAATLNTVVLYLHGHDKFPMLGRDPDGLSRWLPARDGGPAEGDGTGVVAEAGADDVRPR